MSMRDTYDCEFSSKPCANKEPDDTTLITVNNQNCQESSANGPISLIDDDDWSAPDSEHEALDSEHEIQIQSPRKSSRLASPSPKKSTKHTINLDVMSEYKRVRKTTYVPPFFVIPSTSLWSAQYHSFNLGEYVGEVRKNVSQQSAYYEESNVTKFHEIGLTTSEKYALIKDEKERTILKNETIIAAYQLYKNRFETATIEPNFLIREKDLTWPAAMRGMHLGRDFAELQKVKGYKFL